MKKTIYHSLHAALVGALLIAASLTLAAQTKPDISTPEAFLQYLRANRQNVALASFSLRANGSIDFSEPFIAHNAEVKMPLQSLGKVIQLATYAKAISKSEISPARLVKVSEWENYYLPGTDGGAHDASLESFSIPRDEFGFATNPDAMVTVEQLVRAMIRYSDNAARDWFVANLKPQTVREVLCEGNLTGQDFPLYFLGNDLAYENHETGLSNERNLRYLKSLSNQRYRLLVNRLTAKFQNPTWRRAEFEWRLANAEKLGNADILREGELVLSDKGTVRDYALLMAGVITGTFISAEVSATMRNFLEQTMAFELFGEADLFAVAGEKTGGSSGGYLTNASYTIAKAGDYAGKRRITVLFQRLIPTDILTEQFTTLIPFRFQSKLARERMFALQVRRAFPLH